MTQALAKGCAIQRDGITFVLFAFFLAIVPARFGARDAFQGPAFSALQSTQIFSCWTGFMNEALDDQGLDARDAQNRPIAPTSNRSELRDLFAGSVFDLLVTRDLPAISAIRKTLQDLLSPLSQQIGRAVRSLLHFVQLGLIQIKKLVSRPMSAWQRLPQVASVPHSSSSDFLLTHSLATHPVPIRC